MSKFPFRRSARPVLPVAANAMSVLRHTPFAQALRRALRSDQLGLLSATASVALGALASGQALANPLGGSVVAGSASIVQATPDTLNIVQSSNRAIIDWRSFSIGAGETVNFLQPGARSVTLNRVTGNDPSAIFGSLNATGTVMLVNPNGVIFGASSRVDVGGLVATTANIANADFMAGDYRFSQASLNADARVVNHGQISIRDAGLAALVAPGVENAGVIQARLGRVALGGAQTFALDFQGDGLLSFDASSVVRQVPQGAEGQALVVNTGRISADGGLIELSARAVQDVINQVINTEGVIAADTVGSRNGRIVLSGGDGAVRVAGTVQATGAQAGERGGQVAVTGHDVAVVSGALIDVSGQSGGGRIALGSDGSIGAAWAEGSVLLEQGATLNADAITQGDGGEVTLLSKRHTQFEGSISAKGGAQGGNGGFSEVSSRQTIVLTGDVDLTAAQGKSGELLIDPETLRITDSDVASNTGNEVARGWLENQAATASITLEADGLITIDRMGGGLIDLKTNASNSFTLRSLLRDGIVFVDSGTEIRTQGGAITLEARGVGGTLSNIGKLTSNGGAINLISNSGIFLGNALNAGAGNIVVQSIAGSINGLNSDAVLSGARVSLLAAAGNVGTALSAVRTATSALVVETGGHLNLDNASRLDSLSITSRHVLPNALNTYALQSEDLTFSLADGASYTLARVEQDGLDFRFSGDRGMTLGTLDVGGGHLQLVADGGSLLADSEVLLRAGTLQLSATGAIGAADAHLGAETSVLEAAAQGGGLYLDNVGSLSLSVQATGDVSVATTGALDIEKLNAAGYAVTLGAGGGSILTQAGILLDARSLNLDAAGAIGAAGNRLLSNATSFTASAGQGGVYASLSGSSAVLDVTSGDGAIDLKTAGQTTARLISATSAAANGITLEVASGGLNLGDVDAGSDGDVLLQLRGSGAVQSTGGTRVTGQRVTLNTPTTSQGAIGLNTQARFLDIDGGGSISIQQDGDVRIDRLVSGTGEVVLGNAQGDITLVTVAAAGKVDLSTEDGSIFDDGDLLTGIASGGSVKLAASLHLGTSAAHLATATQQLYLYSGGDIYVDNDARLNTLRIDNRHAVPDSINVLQVNSPFLNFDIIDDGSRYRLNEIDSALLEGFSFVGDQTLVIGEVRGSTSANLILQATDGDILDDGDAQTRITGGYVTLVADAGSLGDAVHALNVNTTILGLTTAAHLYVSNIADLSSLTLHSSHLDADARYTYRLTAPSLVLNLSDGTDGYRFNTLTDVSGLSFDFSGDRDLYLGDINLSRAGSLKLVSTTGSILDDGDEATRVLADRIDLNADGGSVGDDTPLTVVAQTLSANAGDGDVNLVLAMPTHSTVNQTTFGAYAYGGSVTLDARQGDLLLNAVYADGDILLNAAQGSIAHNGGSLQGSDVSLQAKGFIGQADKKLQLNASGVVSASAGSGDIALHDTSGSFQLGEIDAGAAQLHLSGAGSLLDDGDADTRLRASKITLDAGYALGSADTALGLATTGLSASGAGAMNLDNDGSLSDLVIVGRSPADIALTDGNIERFSLLAADGLYYLEDIASRGALNFGFTSTTGDLRIGSVDTRGGSVSLTAAGSIATDGLNNGAHIDALRVALKATGSIGSADDFGTLLLAGTRELALEAARNFHIDSDARLSTLALIVNNTTSTANQFAISALDQTFDITDADGSHRLSAIGGTDLGSFSFSGNKSLVVGSITASDSVSLSSRSGTRNTITQGSGSGIAAGAVSLFTQHGSTDAAYSSIGASGTALKLATARLSVGTSSGFYLTNTGLLDSLDLRLRHNSTASDSPTYAYSLSSSGLTFSLTDSATTTTVSNVTRNGLAFSLDSDRAITVSTINTGGRASGSVSLIASGSDNSTTGMQPRISGGTITSGSVNLSAANYNGSISGISTVTNNLALASAGNVSVSNSGNLDSLALTANVSNQGNSASYTITAGNISQNSITYSSGSSYGLLLGNFVANNLALTLNTQNTLTANTVNVGGGSVTLTGRSVQGQSASSRITAGAVTLNADSVGVYASSSPLLLTTSRLSGQVRNHLNVSNTGNLTLGNLALGSGRIESSASILYDGASIKATSLELIADAGSIGSSLSPLQLDVRNLSLSSGYDIRVDGLADLYSLNVTNRHAQPGRVNVVQVSAPQLLLDIVDDGSRFVLTEVSDASGIDFSFKSDLDIDVARVDVQRGRNLSLTTDGSLTSHAADIHADTVWLAAGGAIGAADAAFTTHALSLGVSAGTHIYVDNTLDLSALSFNNTQSGNLGASYRITSGPAFGETAPTLSFVASDDGVDTFIETVSDSTGINFTAQTAAHRLVYGSLDTAATGALSGGLLSLISATGIVAADAASHLNAASLSFTTLDGAGIGSSGSALRFTAPRLTLDVTGDYYLDSDIRLDELTVDTQRQAAGTVSTYVLTAPELNYQVTDAAGGATVNVADTHGLRLRYNSGRSLVLGDIDLGETGMLSLSTANGGASIVGDGNPGHQITTGVLDLNAAAGAIGAPGAAVQAYAASAGATAGNGGVRLNLKNSVDLTGISATGDTYLENTEGDIRLGSINLSGNKLFVINYGGSILSGSLSNVTSVNLDAYGSIGNGGVLYTSAFGGSGGTTSLTAIARTNARGATGSITINESNNLNANGIDAQGAVKLSSGYALTADNIVGPGGVTLDAGRALNVGKIDGGSAAVSLTAQQGDITGLSGNLIRGGSVALSANYTNGATAYSIGTSGSRIKVDTPVLSLTTPKNIYVTNDRALDSLSIIRTTSNYTSGGTIDVSATGLVAVVSDSAITRLINSGDLDFTFHANRALTVNTLNAGGGTVSLSAQGYQQDGSIVAQSGSSLITAGHLNLSTSNYSSGGTTSAGSIGTSAQALRTSVDSISASAPGLVNLDNQKSIRLDGISSGADLSVVTRNGGDITLGGLSYGYDKDLTLKAAGRINAGSGTLYGNAGTIHLEAVSGIGSAQNAVSIYGLGDAVNAKVTGAGDIHLQTAGTLSGGLTTSTANGSTTVNASGTITLTDMKAVNGDIRVTSSGTLTADQLRADGGSIVLASTAGSVLAVDGDSVVRAQSISVSGAGGVGSAAQGLNTIGSQVVVNSGGGGIYLSPTEHSTLAVVNSKGGTVVVRAAQDLYLGTILSGGGAIDAIAQGALYAGNVNAGTGTVKLEGSSIRADDDSTSLIQAAQISLKAADGIGEAGRTLFTRTAVLDAEVTAAGDLFIVDDRATGVELRNVRTHNGDIDIRSAGALTATQVVSAGDAQANTIYLSNASGDLLLGSVQAGATRGSVELVSAGDILRTGDATTNLSAHTVSLSAAGNIGAVADLIGGDADPIRLAASRLAQASADRRIALLNTGNLVLEDGSLSLASDGTLYLETLGHLDARTLDILPAGDVALIASGELYLPAGGLTTTGDLRLVGEKDVFDPNPTRILSLAARKLYFVSGSEGGETTLVTETGDLDVRTTANNLKVSNTGTLEAVSVRGAADVEFVNDRGFTLRNIGSSGVGKRLLATATTGDLRVADAVLGSGTLATLRAADGNVILEQAISGVDTLEIRATEIHAVGVSSTGAQRYFGRMLMSGDYHAATWSFGVEGDTVLQGDTTVTASRVSLGAVDGAHQLAIDADTLILLGVVGNTQALTRLTIEGDGTLRLGKDVTTSGSQQYQKVLLTGNALLTSQDAGIRFERAVDGGHDLQVVSGGAGDIVFAGAVGSETRIGALRIDTAGNSDFEAAITAASVQTDVPGSVRIGADIDTTGSQHYGEHLTLRGDLELTASEVTLGQGADGAHALSIIGNARLLGAVGAATALSTLSISGSAQLDGGSINTVGGQAYGGAVALGAQTALLSQGGDIRFDSSLDGEHGLSVTTGDGDAIFDGKVGDAQRLGALTINSAGATQFKSAVKAVSLLTDAAGTLEIAGGTVDTTGEQNYGERVLLSADTVLKGSEVVLLGGVDASTLGGQSLAIEGNASLGGVGQTPLSSLSVTGTSTINASVNTTGEQRYGGTLILNNDIRLKASKVILAQGVGGASAGTQSLRINGEADIGGEQGDIPQLLNLEVSGKTTFSGGSLSTAGDQLYRGAVSLAQDQSLASSGGSLTFGSTLDSANAASLTLSAAQHIEVAGEVGGTSPLGALVLSAGQTVEFAAKVRVGSIEQAAAGGTTRFYDDLQVDGEDGIDLTGNGFVFDGAVKADNGAIKLHNSDDDGSITFNGPILAKGDFTQSGGAEVHLPASITITDGGMRLQTVATLSGEEAQFDTTGDIEIAGLKAAQTWLTLSSGLGALKIGQIDGDLLNGKLMDVAGLTVTTAGSADLFGSIGGVGGRKVARSIDSTLKRAPYFINGTPWGGDDVIPQLIAVTAPETVIPTTPQADPLFSLSTDPSGMTPQPLDAYLSPEVLSAERYGAQGACSADTGGDQRQDCQI